MIYAYDWHWDRNQEDLLMVFTFNTPVLWDFLGISGDGGIDAKLMLFCKPA